MMLSEQNDMIHMNLGVFQKQRQRITQQHCHFIITWQAYVYFDDCHPFLLYHTCYPIQLKVILGQLLLIIHEIKVLITLNSNKYIFFSLERHRFIKCFKSSLPHLN